MYRSGGIQEQGKGGDSILASERIVGQIQGNYFIKQGNCMLSFLTPTPTHSPAPSPPTDRLAVTWVNIIMGGDSGWEMGAHMYWG